MLFPKVMKELAHCYNEPHRSYHSMKHIHSLTRMIWSRSYEQHLITGVKFDTFAYDGLRDFLLSTAWAHDAYYDPYQGSPTNEYFSRLLFLEVLQKYSDELTAEDKEIGGYVEYAILLTAEHSQYIGEYIPEQNKVFHLYSWPMCLEMFLFMDLDMFGFYDEDECRANNKSVREEYYKTSDVDYNTGRENSYKHY